MDSRKIKKRRWVDTPAFGNTIGLGLIIATIVTIGILYPRKGEASQVEPAPVFNIFVLKKKPPSEEQCSTISRVATEAMYKHQYSDVDPIETADEYGKAGDLEARMVALEAFTYPVQPDKLNKDTMITNFGMFKAATCFQAMKSL